MTSLPTISFVVATRDEAAGIEACVHSLLNQHYPADRIEVAVVDAGSGDGTTDIVAALAAADSRVRLYHNPRRIAASAFNIGARATTGDLISLVSGHSTLAADYAAMLADAFDRSGAALVGGRMEAVEDPASGPCAAAIVRATSSPLGLGPARFHYSEEARWVDTAFPGAYRRELFAEIGGFDESLVRNQDDEFHLRARLAGHAMWFDPRLRSSYHPRRSLDGLWRQYFEYGWWRAVTILKHRRIASARHLAPAALVAGIAGGPALVAATRRHRRQVARAWVGGLSGWVILLTFAGWRERRASAAIAGRVPLAVGCLHLAYGLGFWRGLTHRAVRSITEGNR